MGRWGCWLAVAVHVVVRGKEAMGSIEAYSVAQKMRKFKITVLY